MRSGMGQELALELDLALDGRRRRVSPEVKSLVALARDMAALPDPEIDARFAAKLEQRLLTEGLEVAPKPARRLQVVPKTEPKTEPTPQRPATPTPVIPLPRRRFVVRRGMVAAVAAAMLLAFPVAASATALPGSPFHTIKVNIMERIELAFAGDAVDEGFTHLRFADRRIDEIGQLLALGAEGPVTGALGLMQGEQVTGAEKLQSGTSDPAVLERGAQILRAQAGSLAALAKQLSDDVRPAALDAAVAAKALAARLAGSNGPSTAASGDAATTAAAGGSQATAVGGTASDVASKAGTVTKGVASQVPDVPDEPPGPANPGGSSSSQTGDLTKSYLP